MCAPFDPPPEASQENQPVNPMAFPPGLIPKLVRDKGRQLMPYSPLGPLEIDRAGALHANFQAIFVVCFSMSTNLIWKWSSMLLQLFTAERAKLCI